jgi:hypothetical protein
MRVTLSMDEKCCVIGNQPYLKVVNTSGIEIKVPSMSVLLSSCILPEDDQSP